MAKKIFILLGHPDKESFNARLADAYLQGVIEKGREVKRVNLGDLKFDPILHRGYKVIQELEPDLVAVQENIKWCNHFVIFYPSWWSTMPALLKGMFDRMWLPGFAFNFSHSGITHGYAWKRLLRGKTARVFVTSDSPVILARLLFGDSTNEIKKGILCFAGFSTSVTKIGGIKRASPKKMEKIMRKMKEWGSRGY